MHHHHTNLEDTVTLYEAMQENLNLHLGIMPKLADIIEEWQITDYYEMNAESMSISKMISEAEVKLGYKVDANNLMDVYGFMALLYGVLSGTPYKDSIFPVLPSAYFPFLVNYIKYNLLPK